MATATLTERRFDHRLRNLAIATRDSYLNDYANGVDVNQRHTNCLDLYTHRPPPPARLRGAA